MHRFSPAPGNVLVRDLVAKVNVHGRMHRRRLTRSARIAARLSVGDQATRTAMPMVHARLALTQIHDNTPSASEARDKCSRQLWIDPIVEWS